MTRWMGIEILKTPLDLWIMQEIIFEIKPDLIIETGTFKGGSALYYSQLFDMIGKGRVVTIDLEFRDNRIKHPRLRYVLSSSTDELLRDLLDDEIKSAKTIMVVLDSDHSKDHVLDEMNFYARYVTNGSYMVVEDTALNGHPINPHNGPGPMEALDVFMSTNKDFVVDKTREKFLMTWHPNGFLKKL